MLKLKQLLKVINHFSDMSCSTRKLTLWTLRKVLTRISLSIHCRLIRTDTFRLLLIFGFMNHYSIPLSHWDGMCRPKWSGSIHYAESIMVFFRGTAHMFYWMNFLVVNPFPHAESFWRFCHKQLMKTLKLKKKLLKTSNFSFCHNIFNFILLTLSNIQTFLSRLLFSR